MKYKNKNLEELGKKIDNLDNQNKKPNIKKKESGAGFGFKISTEIIAALVVGVGIGLIVDNYFNPHSVYGEAGLRSRLFRSDGAALSFSSRYRSYHAKRIL